MILTIVLKLSARTLELTYFDVATGENTVDVFSPEGTHKTNHVKQKLIWILINIKFLSKSKCDISLVILNSFALSLNVMHLFGRIS